MILFRMFSISLNQISSKSLLKPMALVLFCIFLDSCNFLGLGSILKKCCFAGKRFLYTWEFTFNCRCLEVFVHGIFFLFILRPRPNGIRACLILIQETLLIVFYWT